MADPIRIANCSGFFGDRISGAREMVEDCPIDVLAGDWLAELTMLILARTRVKRPNGGYARTFVTQLEQVMGTRPEITERSVRFRTLGCFPLTGAVESEAQTLPEVIQETLLTTTSERQGRAIDKDAGGAGMEKKKQEGYF